MIDFRKEIKKLMKKQKINTPELARRAGLNAQTLYNFLAGKSEMTAGNLSVILDILGVDKIKL
jgi:transcriptional regulator with XRE-family HTH domain